MSRLLIHESPLQVLPSLARAIGLNEAIILQQIHYWINPDHNKNLRQGRHWVYNSYPEWQQQFPFWSKETIKRTVHSLEKQQLIFSQKLSEEKFDQRKWYSINYEALQRFEEKNDRWGQNDLIGKGDHDSFDQVKMTPWRGSDCSDPYKEQRLLPEITPETNTHSGVRANLQEFGKEEEAPLPASKIHFHVTQDAEQKMIDIWNQTIQPDIPIQALPVRISKLKAMLIQSFKGDLSAWEQLCKDIKNSPFLMGQGPRKWHITLDWILDPLNFQKVLEGNFKEKTPSQKLNLVNIVEKDQEVQELIDQIEDPFLQQFCRKLLSSIGSVAYLSWFREIQILERSEKEIMFSFPTNFIADKVKDRFAQPILRCLQDFHPEIGRFTCVSEASPHLERDKKTCVQTLKKAQPIRSFPSLERNPAYRHAFPSKLTAVLEEFAQASQNSSNKTPIEDSKEPL